MITKEMIKEAALKVYPKDTIDETVQKQCRKAYQLGTEYAIQQMNNDAVEFAEWAGLKFWEHVNGNQWVLKDLFGDDYNKIITTKELYQLYLNSKNTKQFQFRFIRGDKNKDTTVYTVVEI